MTTTDVEQLQSTKSEKLLAFVMVAFLLVGGVWAYQRIDDRIRDWMPVRQATATEQAAFGRLERATRELSQARGAVRRTRSDLELRREAYRTALDAGEPADRLRARYLAANEEHERARRQQAEAQRRIAAARPAATAAEARLARDVGEQRDRQELSVFLVRLAAAAAFVVAAYWLLWHFRERSSRYLPLAGAAVAYAAIFALVVAADYLTDYFDPLDAGLLLLSLLGVVVTLFAFWLLQRYLRRRLPYRRARRRQCPACGFPAGDNVRCEGCGRELIGPCASCGAARRLAVPFCGRCGAA